MNPKRFLSAILVLMLAVALGYSQTTPAAGGSQGKSAAKSTRSSAGKQKLDINTATKDQLDALPGIGAAYSQKIIDGRPYNAKNDLVRRNIIPQSTYDGIKDQIIAHHAGGTKASKKSQ